MTDKFPSLFGKELASCYGETDEGHFRKSDIEKCCLDKKLVKEAFKRKAKKDLEELGCTDITEEIIEDKANEDIKELGLEADK